MKPIAHLGALLLGVFAGAAAAEAPAPKDFARGLSVTTAPGLPVQQFTLPDAVYQGVARADLGDLRVFNGGGIVVPHALCTGAPTAAETVREAPLNVFALQPGARAATGDTRVNVQTPSGTSVQIQDGVGTDAPAADAPERFVVDATALQAPLRALQLAWSTADGASQTQVRVETSEDLDRWRTVVAGTTLLHVAADGRTLERNRIELPPQAYRYLRLARSDGPAVRIERVTAEVVHAGAAPEPFWFSASRAISADAGDFAFDAGRQAPVEGARVDLPGANMSLRVRLESRRQFDAAWQPRWSGEVSSVQAADGTRVNGATIAFGAVTDALWRIRVLRGGETLGAGQPDLALAYHPARLRFAAQGDAPFVLAYGSVRAPPADTPACDALLAQFSPAERAGLIGAAQVAPAPAALFGGSEALAPPPKPTPVRQIVLWAVLLLGAAALVAMALSLLKRLRESGSAR